MTNTVLQQELTLLSEAQHKISPERLRILDEVAAGLSAGFKQNVRNVQFICTHNSRRSILGQVWGWVLSEHLGLDGIGCHSGGTSATGVYKTVIETLKKQGLKVEQNGIGANPEFTVHSPFSDRHVTLWSKRYDDAANPDAFVAIMTCSDAEENCPVIPNAFKRLSLTYNDPKIYDNSPEEADRYLERSRQIGTELYYIFNHLNL